MDNIDLKWHQRFTIYLKVLSQLEKFVKKGKDLNEMEEQGLIKSFEYTYELAWNTIKDFYESQGETNIQGSRDAIQLAFKRGLINDGGRWMEMLQDRNRTSHTYNEKTANEIAENILTKYFGRFIELKTELENIQKK